MRLQLNLNKHYKDLDLEKINRIFGSMLDMKPDVDDLEKLYNLEFERELNDKEKIAKKIRRIDLEFRVNQLDSFMRECGSETIFGTNEDELNDEQIKKIIEEYKFLMSEPEKEENNKKNELSQEIEER